ncbi:hypothetical protein KIN20_025592 [Parelaphostrongylus tenuis]|uniref:DUF3719 domain-containing protein n=1 Tax=Parelaphostrongylus tenuis TaxID=148309 RepID=A0AAD5NAW0_PARTN|nr:hypothetical protein KIN20_025592 [Parelaphostrongylus tenuis]
MSKWSESVYSEPNTARGHSNGFLSQLDACLYEGVRMNDESLDNEAREWAARFPHLRVVGTKCSIVSHKSQESGTRWSVLSEKEMKVSSSLELSGPIKTSFFNNGSDRTAQHRGVSDRLPRLASTKKK